MKKYLKTTSLFVSALLMGSIFLSSCSKDDGPAKKIEIEEEVKPLVLTLSSASITEGDAVQFFITANKEAITNATIYIDGTAIDAYEHTFAEVGTFKAVAKKEGYLDSQEVNIEVSGELVDIYVAGYEHLNGSDIATYWKNGEPHYLTDGTYNSHAYTITVHDSDVYVLVVDGYAIKYWKNDQENTAYEHIGRNPNVGDMCISETGDVYVTGSVWVNDDYVAKYWKNGLSTDLLYNNENTHANGIAVNNKDLYIAGYSYSRDANNQIPTAIYWKNGVPVPLSDGNVPTYAHKIAVSGDDVHVVGVEQDGGNWSPKYWKNGVEIPLPSGSYAADIAIVGDDVYIAIGGSWKIWHWKNGISTEMGDAANVEGIAVYDNSVYTVGRIHNETNGTFAAAYWKNTTLFSLTDETHDSNARSIAVVKRPD